VISKANLKLAMPEIKIEGDVSYISMLVADGNYEASLLLFDGIWNKKQFPVKGDIVVYVPSRETVLIAGSEDKEALNQIHGIVYDKDTKWPHAVADVGFVRKQNKWVEYKN